MSVNFVTFLFSFVKKKVYGSQPYDQPSPVPEGHPKPKGKKGVYFPSTDDAWRTKGSLLLNDKNYDNVSLCTYISFMITFFYRKIKTHHSVVKLIVN